jgi:hypothetical protein
MTVPQVERSNEERLPGTSYAKAMPPQQRKIRFVGNHRSPFATIVLLKRPEHAAYAQEMCNYGRK